MSNYDDGINQAKVTKINGVAAPRRVMLRLSGVLNLFVFLGIGATAALVFIITAANNFDLSNHFMLLAIIGGIALAISLAYPLYQYIRQAVVLRYGHALIGKVTEVHGDVSVNGKLYYRVVVEYSYFNNQYKTSFSMTRISEPCTVVVVVLGSNPKMAELYGEDSYLSITGV